MAILTGCWWTDIAILFFTGFVGLYYYFKKIVFTHWEKLKIPYAKPKFPLGNLQPSENIVLVWDQIYKEFENEKVVGVWQANQPAVLIKDLEVIRDVLVKEFMSFHDRGVPVDEENDPLSAHLFSLGGSQWRNLRAKLSPTFTSGKMKMMFPILMQCAREMIDILEPSAKNKNIVEMKDILARFTTDIISSCAFGIDTNSLKNPDAEFRKMGKVFVEPTLKNTLRNIVFFIPGLNKLLKMRFFPKEQSDFFMKSVREIIDYRENNNVKRNDFMQLLIQLKNKGTLDDVDDKGSEDENKTVHKFTFEQAAAQAVLFFLAGFETSSSTMQFSLYELALNPEIQDKLRNEIKTVLAKHNGEITYEAVFEMEYLGNVIDETLRKYPVAALLVRESNKEYKIPDSNIVLPKGTIVQVPTYSLHMDPKYYPEPKRFDPDRFKEKAKAARPRYAYLPFGEGPRNCIGMRFGLMQTRVGLVTLLLNYKFEICEKSPIPLVFSTISLSPKEGMHLRISKAN